MYYMYNPRSHLYYVLVERFVISFVSLLPFSLGFVTQSHAINSCLFRQVPNSSLLQPAYNYSPQKRTIGFDSKSKCLRIQN